MIKYTDNEHIKNLVEGRHESFHYLFTKYFPKLKYFISHIIKTDIVAEDLAQEIFARIWSQRKSLSHIESFNSYVYLMARNESLNYLKRKTIEDTYLKNHVREETISIEEEIEAKEIEFLVLLEIEKMPPQRKKVYEMSRIENLKNEEIATKLNLSKKTIENHLNLALKDIRKIFSGLISLLF